ncbi:MAG: DUF192 domain-containing protein [Longimicrobiales bacterium]|nr:DUF192 domain-containing protein [Longimicrobiales bacterium]
MREVSVVQADTGVAVASSVAVADSFPSRLRGLLARPPMAREQGLLLLECGSIHTVGMRYSIDVAFLDADGRVVRSITDLGPWRLGLGGAGAVHALELPAGRLRETGTDPGTRLSWS